VRAKSPEQVDRMLDAAARLFGAHRFHEVRMDDVAAAAEVGKGTLYRYFRDKEELYLALLDRAGKQMRERIHAVVDAATGPREKLTALVAAVFEFFDEQPHVHDLIQRAEALRGSQTPWQPARTDLTQLTHDLLADAAATGAFRVTDPETTALMLLGGMRSVILFGRKPRPADLAGAIVRHALEGAATPAG
jgi:AcrR family transcriptional regulator